MPDHASIHPTFNSIWACLSRRTSALPLASSCSKTSPFFRLQSDSISLTHDWPPCRGKNDLDRKPNIQHQIKTDRPLGFSLTDEQVLQIEIGKDFVQLKNGPFDVDFRACNKTVFVGFGCLVTLMSFVGRLIKEDCHGQTDWSRMNYGSKSSRCCRRLSRRPRVGVHRLATAKH